MAQVEQLSSQAVDKEPEINYVQHFTPPADEVAPAGEDWNSDKRIKGRSAI